MKFDRIPLAAAEGAILAHSLKTPGGPLKKGLTLTAAHLEALRSAGVATVTAAVLGPEDRHEDEAAARLAAALAPDPSAQGLAISAAFTGRANLYAERAGLLQVDAALIDRLNALDEAVTVATLAPMTRVEARRMAATVKIIPFAAPEAALARAERLLAEAATPALALAPFAPRAAELILTRTPGMKPQLLEKAETVVRDRLAALGLRLDRVRITPHETGPLAEAMASAAEAADLVLALGASATTDRRDVTPAAILAAGGRIERLGMPVDPGNLLVLGALGPRAVVGLPGCARSPKLNGADFVLERLAAGVPVTSADIAAMGVGGLLGEIASRPSPRVGAEAPALAGLRPRVAGVLLAAGGSSRMGPGRHKLFEEIDGAPLLRRSAGRLAASGLSETVVVVGAEAARARAALAGAPARLVENARWREGAAASIRAGLEAIDPEADAALIALADMPEVDAALIDRLIAAFAPEDGREIARPRARNGRLGHPVLFGRRFFEALGRLEGDVGARAVVAEHAEFVVEVQAENDAPVIDLDAPEDWERWRAAAEAAERGRG